jgi:benzylsuccinate CoA-transferase BbsF subunit
MTGALPAFTSPSSGALSDLKVADFSWAAAAPIATKNLADLGATVVRIESGVHIDSVRITGPFPNDKPGLNTSGFYADFNTSKYGVALDLSRPESRPVAERLIEWADVVVESFTPRIMAKWGLSYADIVTWKPDIIMLSSCMQGQTGPYRDYSGFGNQGAAIAGLHYLTGWPDIDPAGPKGAYSDAIAPRFSITSILAALDYRERTGKGQYIDMSQIETAISSFLVPEMLDYTVNGRLAHARGNRSSTAAPHGAFPCTGDDRWITIAVETDLQWEGLVAAIGDAAWVRDTRFASLAARRDHEDELEERLASWTRTLDAFEAVEMLQRHGVPAGVVAKAVDLFEDPQLAHRDHFWPLEHPEMGTYLYNGPAYRLSETPAIGRWAPPMLGEHTDYVLKELLGYSAAEIEALAAAGLLR